MLYTIQKKIALCGAKGAGKTELLKGLESKGLDGLTFTDAGEWDRLADYRTELSLALHRSDQALALEPGIYESSLLDSIAYSAVRVSYIINDEVGSEDDLARWQLTMHTAARLLRDSWTFDGIIFVPGHDPEDFYEQLEEAIRATVWEFLPDTIAKYELKENGVLPRVEETAKILEALNESGNTNKESDGEDI